MDIIYCRNYVSTVPCQLYQVAPLRDEDIKYAKNMQFKDYMTKTEIHNLRNQIAERLHKDLPGRNNEYLNECVQQERMRIVRISSDNYNLQWEFNVMPYTEWTEFIEQVIINISNVANNPNEIIDVAFNENGICMNGKSEMLDTRPRAKKPFYSIDDGAVLHIAMVKRSEWIPLCSTFDIDAH
jgi:hypothetical protein